MSDPGKAVFLSYASQDADAAQRICEALRAAGIEVWFDRDELVGGDAWDQKIRKQIKECGLFMPVISANTNARAEGYFRLEWKLAVDRSHLMADDAPFLFPVVIDDTGDAAARVPDRFREVQWTRLNVKDTPETLSARVVKLLTNGVVAGVADPGPASARPATGRGEGAAAPKNVGAPWVRNAAAIGGILIVVFFVVRPPERSKPPEKTGPPAAVATPTPPVESAAQKLVTRALVLCSRLAFTRDDLAVAEDLTRKATDLEPDSARAWGARARVHASFMNRSWDTTAKRAEDTQAIANRALAIDPANSDALYALSVVRRRQGALEEADALARRALAVNPNDGYISRSLAEAARALGRRDEALAILQEALRRNPRDPLTLYGIASGYANLGSGYANIATGRTSSPDELALALKYYDAALAVDLFASALVQRAGLVAAWRGDLGAMRATLDQLEKTTPGDRAEDRSVFIAMWGGLLERQPRRVFDAAALTARSYFEDNTVAEPKAWMLALAHRVTGKEGLARIEWENAERVLRERLREQPGSQRDQAQLAATLAWLGRDPEAAAVIAPVELAARDSEPRSAFNGWMAKYHAARGDAPAAVRLLTPLLDRRSFFTRHSLRLDPWWDKLRGQPEFEALLAEAKARVESK